MTNEAFALTAPLIGLAAAMLTTAVVIFYATHRRPRASKQLSAGAEHPLVRGLRVMITPDGEVAASTVISGTPYTSATVTTKEGFSFLISADGSRSVPAPRHEPEVEGKVQHKPAAS